MSAETGDQREANMRNGYDAVAQEYARRIYDELQHKPFDRDQLDQFAAHVRGKGQVCDLGCGPGHVARYLHDRGAHAFGLDLSPGMVAMAHKLNPGMTFVVGDMLALDAADNSWAGATAFYSIIHIPREQVVAALREIRRALMPGGRLLLAFHKGDKVLHLDEFWGEAVSLDFAFYEQAEIEQWLRTSGFEIEASHVRQPYHLDIEHQSERVYILAQKPPAA